MYNKDSSSSNPNNSPPAMNPIPRREGENLNTHSPLRPRAIRLPTSPRPPRPTLQPMPLLHRFTGQGGFFYYPEMMAGASAVSVGGSSGGVAGGGSGGSPSPAGSKKRASEDRDERKRCRVCGKEFASDRAVYGHMNVHRDMEWQGPVINAQEEIAVVPGANLPQEEGAGDRRAEAESLAEEEAVAAVERRRGIRIDLNVDLTLVGAAPDDDAPDA